MNQVIVGRLGGFGDYPDLAEVSARLDNSFIAHEIGEVNWNQYPYKPSVAFKIAYDDNEIFIRFYVREERVKAEKSSDNQMVCEDSCVEFFVSPEVDGTYYNFEFNTIGTTLLGFGTGRNDNTLADTSVVSGIRRLSSAGSTPFTERGDIKEWTLTVAIPLETFFRHKIKDLPGKSFRANFYKCGDLLSVPHYLTWNRVETEKPDYHRPEYFGILRFE